MADTVSIRARRPCADRGAYCRVADCREPTRAASPGGLDGRYCRKHSEHHQRHGSPFWPSYTASELNPYRRAALHWIEENIGHSWVQDAIGRIEGLYATAGRHIPANRLTGLEPGLRAKAAWARLREANVDPKAVASVWMSIEAITADNPQAAQMREFKQVQAAKVVHRMRSGTHKVWQRESAGRVIRTELHVYPRSRGRVLRHIGRELEQAAELMVEHCLDDFLASYREGSVPAHGARAWPKSYSVRRTVGSITQ